MASRIGDSVETAAKPERSVPSLSSEQIAQLERSPSVEDSRLFRRWVGVPKTEQNWNKTGTNERTTSSESCRKYSPTFAHYTPAVPKIRVASMTPPSFGTPAESFGLDRAPTFRP